MATVELKMSENEFWNCNHRKLQSLLKVHNETLAKRYGNSVDEEEVYGDTISL